MGSSKVLQDYTVGSVDIAEWTVANQGDLNMKYVIYGERIWDIENDSTDLPWSDWRELGTKDGTVSGDHW